MSNRQENQPNKTTEQDNKFSLLPAGMTEEMLDALAEEEAEMFFSAINDGRLAAI